MPTWAGVDSDAFMAGFGICLMLMATLWAFLISFHMLKSLIRAAGL